LPAVVVLAAAIALWQLVRAYRPELHDARLRFAWGPLLIATAIWLAGYTQLVQMWAVSLKWWKSPPIKLRSALRMFFLANLARYIPGGVWQFAGLSALAATEGASPSAAAMGVILMQIATLATGAAITLSAAPRFVAPWTRGLGIIGQLVLACVLVALLVVVLPRALPHIRRRLERRFKRPIPLPAPPPAEFAVFVVRAALGWIMYGVAFWLFSRALLGDGAPTAWIAATAYVASYLVGLLVIFAPGGIVVREGTLVLCLQGAIGARPALILAISSRLWLVAMELGAALTMLVVDWIQKARGVRASASQK
jgi:hypothetical protein